MDLYVPRSSAHARWEMAAGANNPGHVFTPTDITAISAILDVGTATLVSGDISSLPDLLNSNPAVQTVAARRPTLELSGNGLPCMRFATNDVLSWPITAQSSAINYAGYGLWFKPDVASASERFMHVAAGTGGASGTKLTLRKTSATAFASAASPDGSNFKTNTPTTTIATGWSFLTVEYDKDGATDGAKITITQDGTVLTPSVSGSATLGALFAATGNILIGNGSDSGSANAPFNGLIGPQIYAFGSKTAGATTGLMSSSERTSLMLYKKPT